MQKVRRRINKFEIAESRHKSHHENGQVDEDQLQSMRK